jgi:hypothetical protein
MSPDPVPNPRLDAPDTPDTPDNWLPPADDPGGAHAKGFSADPDPTAPKVPDPVPLADAKPGGIHVPERDDGVQPTGRSEPGPYNPDARVIDSGR